MALCSVISACASLCATKTGLVINSRVEIQDDLVASNVLVDI